MNVAEYNRRLLRDKGIHYVVVMYLTFLIIISAVICGWALYGGMTQMQTDKPVQQVVSNSPAQPLPDFIVDKVEPNELEQLKP